MQRDFSIAAGGASAGNGEIAGSVNYDYGDGNTCRGFNSAVPHGRAWSPQGWYGPTFTASPASSYSNARLYTRLPSLPRLDLV